MWQGIKNQIHLLQAVTATVINGFPARNMKIIGVTGTDGKTTTSNIIFHVLKEAGHKAALVSTVSAVIGDDSTPIGFHVTTPRFFALQKYFKKAKAAGTKYFILEVTSHALDQNRVYGVPFAIGVLTNISNEHLDYHKTYERYVKAKAKLLRTAKTAVINKDDKSYRYVLKHLKHKHIVTYGFKSDSKVNMHNFHFKTKLMGRFNEYNCLAAIAALRELGIADDVIRRGIASFKTIEGRQQIIYNKDFQVINDFAHTPNSFAGLLPVLKQQKKNKLIHVFGAAAKRDMYKRPEMGKIAGVYDDIIILTAEDPRNEPVEKIMDEIADGIQPKKFEEIDSTVFRDSNMKIQPGKKYLFRIPDRKDAIQFAVSIARRGDIVVMTGKGHERSMNYGQGEEGWNENEIAEAALKHVV